MALYKIFAPRYKATILCGCASRSFTNSNPLQRAEKILSVDKAIAANSEAERVKVPNEMFESEPLEIEEHHLRPNEPGGR